MVLIKFQTKVAGIEIDDFRHDNGEFGNLVLVFGNRAMLIDCNQFCIEQGPLDA